MVMAVALFNQADSLTLVAGYENGLAMVAHRDPIKNDWIPLYQSTCHSQPILSLSVSPARDFFLTSSADAVIAKHPLPPVVSQDTASTHVTDTQTVPVSERDESSGPVNVGDKAVGKSLLGAALAKAKQQSSLSNSTWKPQEVQTQPLKTVNTKHAGQQGIQIRSDGLVFATAGWDSKVRVYSAKTLKEVAVLKWHQVGCYAVAFADIAAKDGAPSINDQNPQATQSITGTGPTTGTDFLGHGTQESNVDKSLTVVPKLVELTVRDKRLRQAKTAHWLAAGSKDGKVSLWDVF